MLIEKHTSYWIFLVFIVVRGVFILITGYDSCQLCPDCYWINDLSERALHGDFNFDIGRFISAPLYPCIIALHKWLFGNYWDTGLVISQLIISSLSGVYFFKLSGILFPRNKQITNLSTGLFAVFPLTLYWVHTFCTEMLFQSLFIISIYYLVLSIQRKELRLVFLSAVIFSLVFLTKSHILLFTPFIAITYLISVKPISKGVTFVVCYATICFAATLPFGTYNLQRHGEYVLSSNGLKFHFYTGNSEFGYVNIVNVPPKNSVDFIQMKDMNIGYFNGTSHDSIMALEQKEKQNLYLKQSFSWIKNNPEKFLELKFYNCWRFLFPGVSYKQYSFAQWLFSILVSFPIYVLGYYGMILALRKDLKTHFFMFGIFLSLLIFSMVFYTQNRFRTITIEPFYILYAGYGALAFTDYFKGKKTLGSAKK